eukprot:1810920-Prymnesium_polylepis.2
MGSFRLYMYKYKTRPPLSNVCLRCLYVGAALLDVRGGRPLYHPVVRARCVSTFPSVERAKLIADCAK